MSHTRDIEREVYALERMDYDIERGERDLDRAYLEATQARRGIVVDIAAIGAWAAFAALYWSDLSEPWWLHILIVALASIQVISTLGKRARSIRATRKALTSNRDSLKTLRERRLVHAQKFEELAGGVSLAEGGGGELTQYD